MAHSHPHTKSERGKRALWWALLITTLFAIIQLIGGWLARSLALLADAAHMTTDVAALSLSLFALWIAKRPPSPRMTFGFYRAEILGAMISGMGLWVICFFLIYEAVRRLLSPHPVEGELVFIIACITLVFNCINIALLHRSRGENLNIRAAYLHILSDLLGNLGVLIAGGLIWLTQWNWIDPIITFLMTLLILFSSGRMLKEALEILMEATPRGLDVQEIAKALEKIEGVQEVHDLHLWTVSSGRIALSVHLVGAEEHSLLQKSRDLLMNQFKIEHTTIQVEPPDEFHRSSCYDCLQLD